MTGSGKARGSSYDGTVEALQGRREVEGLRRPWFLARFAPSLLLMFILGSGCGGAPNLTEVDQAILSARAVVDICAAKCAGLTVYVVSGQIFRTVGEENELPMSTVLRSAIKDQLGQEVLFVDHRRVNDLGVDGQLVDRESSIVLSDR